MKLYEISQENSAKSIADMLLKDCSNFIQAYKQSNKALFRGIGNAQGSSSSLVTGNVRTNRIPSATPKRNFDLMNAALSELDLPTRENSLLCSPKRKVASDWGPVHILFMKDGWKGLCFEHADFDDLYVQSDPIVKSSQGEDAITSMKNVITKFRPIIIDSSDKLVKVLNQNHEEIIMQGTKYYALKINSSLTSEVLKLLELNIKIV